MTVEEAIEFYETADHERKRFVGGYPNSIAEHGGVVAVSIDTTESPHLEMYSVTFFIEWMQTAKEEFESGEHDDTWAAIMETGQDYMW